MSALLKMNLTTLMKMRTNPWDQAHIIFYDNIEDILSLSDTESDGEDDSFEI